MDFIYIHEDTSSTKRRWRTSEQAADLAAYRLES